MRRWMMVLLIGACVGGCRSDVEQPADAFELADGTRVVIKPAPQMQFTPAALVAALRDSGQLDRFEGLTVEQAASSAMVITFDRFTLPNGSYAEDGRIELKPATDRDEPSTGERMPSTLDTTAPTLRVPTPEGMANAHAPASDSAGNHVYEVVAHRLQASGMGDLSVDALRRNSTVTWWTSAKHGRFFIVYADAKTDHFPLGIRSPHNNGPNFVFKLEDGNATLVYYNGDGIENHIELIEADEKLLLYSTSHVGMGAGSAGVTAYQWDRDEFVWVANNAR